MARYFDSQGVKKIQVIDLSGSLQGGIQHARIIKSICHAVDAEVQIGGGIRTMEQVEKAFELGASRVILGVSSIYILKDALAKYGSDKIIMGIKSHDDIVDTDLTIEGKTPEVTDLAVKFADAGVKTIIYKDMSTEGSLYHPNFDMVEKIIYALEGKADVYCSGGISDEYHIKLLVDTGAKGAIIGRALMENALDLGKLI